MSDWELVQAAADKVNDYCTPKKMTPAQAIDFLEDVVASLQSSIEALKEESED